jgi:predicted esterase
MHGLGDSADGFSDVAEMFSTALPHVKFILPTAPSQPVTLNGGMSMNSWYDIVGLDDRASEAAPGLSESRQIVQDILRRENELGIPYSRMMLSGFSQV